ncbi:MAG: hypothetical protein HYY06_20345 [Deltaproteobacteria bacterium]|nr:hypothetical protein [Deltaproteobacteria bacterium]
MVALRPNMRIGTSKSDEPKKQSARVLLGTCRGHRANVRVTIVMIGRDLAFDGSQDGCDPELR